MDKHPVWKTQIRFKGEFDYQGLYAMMKNFFLGKEYDLYEKTVKDKGNYFKVKWQAEREYDEYHRIVFDIFFIARDVEKLVITREGKRETVVKGRIEMAFQGRTETGYNDIPIYDTKSSSGKFMSKMHDKILEREQDEHWDVIVLVMQTELFNAVKQHFGMVGV